MGMQKCFSMFFGGLKCHIRWGCPGQEVESQLKDVQQCLGVTQPCVLPTRVRSSWVGNKHSKIQFYMGVNIYIYTACIYICIYTVYIYARIYSIHIHIHIYIYVWICGMWFINNCELGFSSRYLWGFVLLLQCRTRHYCSGCERRYYFVFCEIQRIFCWWYILLGDPLCWSVVSSLFFQDSHFCWSTSHFPWFAD